jgi:hypothetical protein
VPTYAVAVKRAFAREYAAASGAEAETAAKGHVQKCSRQ